MPDDVVRTPGVAKRNGPDVALGGQGARARIFQLRPVPGQADLEAAEFVSAVERVAALIVGSGGGRIRFRAPVAIADVERAVAVVGAEVPAIAFAISYSWRAWYSGSCKRCSNRCNTRCRTRCDRLLADKRRRVEHILLGIADRVPRPGEGGMKAAPVRRVVFHHVLGAGPVRDRGAIDIIEQRDRTSLQRAGFVRRGVASLAVVQVPAADRQHAPAVALQADKGVAAADRV